MIKIEQLLVEYNILDKVRRKTINKLNKAAALQEARLLKKIRKVSEKMVYIKTLIQELEEDKSKSERRRSERYNINGLLEKSTKGFLPDGTIPNMDKYLSILKNTTPCTNNNLLEATSAIKHYVNYINTISGLEDKK